MKVHVSALSCRFLRVLGLTALLTVAPGAVSAYQFFEAKTGGCRWAETGPGKVDFVVDKSSSSAKANVLLTDVKTTRDRWNGIATAKNVIGNLAIGTADFTDKNLGTAWGVGAVKGEVDRRNEVVLDETGDIIRNVFSRSPDELLGKGITKRVVNPDGTCTITDAALVVNGTTSFSRLPIMVHEMGHVLGLAHSSVGEFNSKNTTAFNGGYGSPSSALRPIDIAKVPAMHPFAQPGVDLATPKADDIAGLSQLYPEASFSTSLGTISGVVTRCSDKKPAAGVNVRAVKDDDPSVQVTRYTAFDGNGQGRFDIRGLPPGNYDVIVEEMGHNNFSASRMAMVSALDQGFPFEHYGPSAVDESGCAEDSRDAALLVGVTRGKATDLSIALNDGVRLAMVVDDTGSMSAEISSVIEVLNQMITKLVDSKEPFPRTAIFSFKDNVTRRIVSDKPAELQAVINGLAADGGDDCPESSNAALMDAGRVLAKGGKAVLFTDADSRADGPSTGSVLEYFRGRGLSLSVLLSATCSSEFTTTVGADGRTVSGVKRVKRKGQQPGVAAAAAPVNLNANVDLTAKPLPSARFQGRRAQAGSAFAESFEEPPMLGREDALSTYSAIAGPSGGVLVVTPRPYDGDDRTAYINAGLNISLGSVTTTVMTAVPNAAAQGALLAIELTGSNTNWTSQSVVQFPGTAVDVSNVQTIAPNRIRLLAQVPVMLATGFYDLEVTTPRGGGATEIASAVGAFHVVAPTPGGEVSSVMPATVLRGEPFDVSIRGLGTSFSATSTVQFLRNSTPDANITVSAKTLVSATELRVQGTVTGDALAGLLDVSVDGLVASRAFTVTEPPPPIPIVGGLEPRSAKAAQAGLRVTVTGVNTHFADGVSGVSFGEGVTTRSVEVTGPTELVAIIDVANTAALGFRDVSINTGDEIAVGLAAFQLLEADPPPPPPPPSPQTGSGGGSMGGGVIVLLLAAVVAARRRITIPAA